MSYPNVDARALTLNKYEPKSVCSTFDVQSFTQDTIQSWNPNILAVKFEPILFASLKSY